MINKYRRITRIKQYIKRNEGKKLIFGLTLNGKKLTANMGKNVQKFGVQTSRFNNTTHVDHQV